MPVIEIVLSSVAAFLVGFFTKVAYDYFTEADLRYVIESPYPIQNDIGGFITQGLLVPLRVFNPKRKTIKNINVRIEFNSPIRNVNAKSDLADIVNSRFESGIMTSTINRLNQDNYVAYFVNLSDIDANANPIKDIAIQSDETKGKKFEYRRKYELRETLSLFIGALLGFSIGIFFTIIYLFTYKP